MENVLVALARRCTTFLGVVFTSLRFSQAPQQQGLWPHSPGWVKAKEVGQQKKKAFGKATLYATGSISQTGYREKWGPLIVVICFTL